MKKIIFLFIFTISSSFVFAQNQPVYPNPEKGFKKVEVKLPKLENEEDYKVEITFAMESERSECSKSDFSFNGIEEKYAIPPYRYPYYVINAETVEIVEGKMSDCEGNKKVKKKIYSTKKLFENYASSFVRHFYIPEKWTVEYRVWKANSDYAQAK